MHKILLSILLVLCIYFVLGKCIKHPNIKLFINTTAYTSKSNDFNLIKKKKRENAKWSNLISSNLNSYNKKGEDGKLNTPNKGEYEDHDKVGLSLKFLKENEQKVIENLKKRGMEKKVEDINVMKNLIHEKNQLEIVRNNLRNKRKILSDKVKDLMLKNKDRSMDENKRNNSINNNDNEFYNANKDECVNEENINMIKNEISNINENINLNETKMFDLKNKIEEHFNRLPNIILNKVPEGINSKSNKIIKTYKIKNINIWDDNFLDPHENIIKRYDNNNDNIFKNISNKIGFGYNILVNNIAKLERALINFMINVHTDKFNYTYVKAPTIISRSALTNTGQLPKFENDLFKINQDYKILNEEAFLIPTSEVSLLNLFKNSLIEHEHLPIKLVSHSPCFRIEKNYTYGKTSKGLLREHIFEKVELISITDKITSFLHYKNLIKHCEYILKKLKIPYRLVLLNSIETPFSASICYDIEAWLPSQKRFLEVSSCSNCLDFQARKLNLKFKKNDKSLFCHTINGSGLAVGRVLAIILEQYQIKRSSKNDKIRLTVPKVLQKYMKASIIDL
ncbi:serine--tRNA ligase, putative [Plasmodium yoelii]|uniref:serine--tRNA ligase n=2 Tax=Plasmodium yoelii TaxID=5861 RepID=A0AAF0B638_PLAYO|nr:serine--tRNA ligase, putative [Plasmodium yoelii]WBY60928.1 serine--tRNA ligase [Plasmodium yoelii yoelii]CDU20688.1 serine--tRNA ligase, putative [Plasmodium yoelii]VTZ81651.1 serine--tRNA ligase, putative [Plasmodium yoelii]|eukprot:XP_022812935.1 serine--tRNA ligase, putative [Plasmodium yoelii]